MGLADHDRRPPGPPRPEAPDTGRRDRLGLALAVSVAAGLLYSLGHYLLVIDTLHVPGHPAPGMAAMAVFFLGVLVGIVALPVYAAVVALLMLRSRGVADFVGNWLLLVFPCGVAWVSTTVVWVNVG